MNLFPTTILMITLLTWGPSDNPDLTARQRLAFWLPTVRLTVNLYAGTRTHPERPLVNQRTTRIESTIFFTWTLGRPDPLIDNRSRWTDSLATESEVIAAQQLAQGDPEALFQLMALPTKLNDLTTSEGSSIPSHEEGVFSP